ncbi:oleate hydratase [Streptomyces sp. NPDC058623]|uniref:oleate hydratase n=1 Tax=Streptomyces sp. NPDC058623 TaxID=3346563 RepID=UPI0036587485
MMPYVTSLFLPRRAGNRPAVVPEGVSTSRYRTVRRDHPGHVLQHRVIGPHLHRSRLPTPRNRTRHPGGLRLRLRRTHPPRRRPPPPRRGTARCARSRGRAHTPPGQVGHHRDRPAADRLRARTPGKAGRVAARSAGG